MTGRVATRVAWSLCAVSVAMAVAGLLFSFANRSIPSPFDYGTKGGAAAGIVALLAFPVVGALIASRQPDNSIGWICLVSGMIMQLSSLSREYASLALDTGPNLPPGAVAMGWVGNWTWPSSFGLSATFLVLLFPDGRLPSKRWLPVAWLSAVGIVAVSVTLAFAPGRMENLPLQNPFALESAKPLLDFLSLGIVLLPLTFAASAVAMAGRFRRSRGRERQQLKWFSSAASVVASLFLLQITLSFLTGSIEDFRNTSFPQRVLQDVVTVSFAAIPIATGIAILRYRLYNIDRIINKTLVYGVVTVLLALGYAGGVLLAQAVLPVTDDSPALVAITTLAVVALFRPLRNRVQGFVDRRFYRRRYDAARTIESFGSRVRQETDLDSLRRELLGLVNDTMQPAHASVWLRGISTERSTSAGFSGGSGAGGVR